MLALLRSFFTDQPHAGAHTAYIALVERARNPFFYERLGVPDTLDGRFEMIVLHLFLLQHRMRAEHTCTPDRAASPESAEKNVSKFPRATVANEEFARNLSELFFADMDRSVRELGVADTGVRYRIKAMAKAYHGRLHSYTWGLEDEHELRSALARNLYGTVAEGSVDHLVRMAAYVRAMRAALALTDAATLAAGHQVWPPLTLGVEP